MISTGIEGEFVISGHAQRFERAQIAAPFQRWSAHGQGFAQGSARGARLQLAHCSGHGHTSAAAKRVEHLGWTRFFRSDSSRPDRQLILNDQQPHSRAPRGAVNEANQGQQQLLEREKRA
jgi:hypothetical protein